MFLFPFLVFFVFFVERLEKSTKEKKSSAFFSKPFSFYIHRIHSRYSIVVVNKIMSVSAALSIGVCWGPGLHPTSARSTSWPLVRWTDFGSLLWGMVFLFRKGKDGFFFHEEANLFI